MKTSQILRVIWLSVLLLLPVSELVAQESRPKREFRGAWIQCVNGQFLGLGTQEMQRTLSYQLDELQKDGVNAIIFQVLRRGGAQATEQEEREEESFSERVHRL